MARRKAEQVRVVTLRGQCQHGLDLVACDICREASLRRIRRQAAQPEFNDLAVGIHDLEDLIREAIPYVAARAVLNEDDRGFWLREISDEVFTVRKLKAFTKALYGTANAHLEAAAQAFVMDRVRSLIRVREQETSVRLYVAWRVPGSRPWRWGALRYLGIAQVEAVARDYGILGDGVEFSKDAAQYLADLMKNVGGFATVADVWEDAVPFLAELRAHAG